MTSEKEEGSTPGENSRKKEDNGRKTRKQQYSRRKKQKANKNKNNTEKKTTTFKGKTEGMNGHIFLLKSETKSVLQFTRTQEQLIRYFSCTYKRSEDMKWMIKNLEDREFEEPEEPTKFRSEVVKDKVFHKLIEMYIAREQAYEEAKSKLWEVIWYQCTKGLQTKLESDENFEEMSENNDCARLLRHIRMYMYTDDNNDYKPITFYNAKLNSMTCRQGTMESVNNYYTRLKGLIEVLEYHDCANGGKDKAMVHYVMGLAGEQVDKDVHLPGEETYDSYVDYARERFWESVLIKNSDNKRFGGLKRELANAYVKGRNDYPGTLLATYELLLKYNCEVKEKEIKPSNTSKTVSDSETESEKDTETNKFIETMTFANATLDKTGDDTEVICFNCGEKGHKSNNCNKPPKDKKGPTKTGKVCTTIGVERKVKFEDEDSESDNDEFGEMGFIITTVSRKQMITTTQQIVLANKELVNKHWILLHTQSTVHIFKNKSLLTDVNHTEDAIRCYCNSGYQDTDEMGKFEGLDEVYYNNTSLANILTFSMLSTLHRITCNTWVENSFMIHQFNGRDMKFVCSPEGLYYHDLRWTKEGGKHLTTSRKLNSERRENVIMINTVQGIKEGFTKKEIKAAELAQRIYILLGRPSYRDFGNIVKWQLLKNCPISFQDVKNAWKMFGEDLGSIRGKTTRRKPLKVDTGGVIPIPTELLFQLQDVTLCADVMFMDKLVVLTTISRRIGFTTVDILPSQNIGDILKAARKVFSLYKSREVPVKYLVTDRQFLPIKDTLLREDDIRLNETSANEHVGDVERNVRVLKERFRAAKAVLPFKALPKLMKIANMKLEAFWLNLFPRKGCISAYYGPRLLLMGEMADFQRICKVPFGVYCEVFDKPSPANTVTVRTTPAIALCPESNIQHSYYFLSLTTWKIISRRSGAWKELPMPQHIIDTVNERGMKELGLQKDDLVPEQYVFKYLDGTLVPIDEDTENQGGENPDDQEESKEEEKEQQEEDTREDEQHNDTSTTNDTNRRTRGNKINYAFRMGMERGNNPTGRVTYETTLMIDHQKLKEVENEYLKEHVMHRDKAKKWIHKRPVKPADGFGQKYGYASQLLLVQMSAKQGLRKFGERAEKAIKAEFHQLIHGKEVFIPRFYSELTKQQRKKALRAITLIDHKRTGKVKGRTVANGSIQRSYIPQDEASSPTVSTEAVFLVSVMNAHEKRVIAVCDISGVFLQAYMDEFVAVIFENEMVDLMIETEPKYEKYVHINSKGKKVLYMQLRKAMYGCMKAAKLWCQEFSNYITKEMGFKLNEYDLCVANKEIDGEQCTIIWHVDDLKISHKKESVVRSVIGKIEDKFGKMSVNIGTKHTYVGMDFEYLDDGSVTIDMIGYLEDALEEFPEELKEFGTPAANNIFEVDVNGERLDDEKSKTFHRVVAMLLFVSKRARPDLQVESPF